MTTSNRIVNDAELDAVSGGRISLVNTPGYHGPTLNKGGTVGQGDTIDTNGFGDITWQDWNGNLPGAGPWGN